MMGGIIELDKNYSTTRRLIQADPAVIAGSVNKSNKSEDEFDTVLLLPEGEGRRGEGGLRVNGYFKVDWIPDHYTRDSGTSESIYEKPLITVVTVVYNGGEFLEETILSVINQTYDNIEYIVIDGGSTDCTLDIIHKYEHAIDYWVSEKDNGIYDAMNKGWSLANPRSKIMFLGAGDKLITLPDTREICKNEQTIIYGNVQTWNGIFLSKHSWRLNLCNTLHHQALLIPKDIYRVSRPFDTRYKVYADYDFNARLKRGGVKFYKSNNFMSYAMPGGASAVLDVGEMSRISLRRNGIVWGLLSFVYCSYAKARS